MTAFFPTEPKKLKERLRRYERAFKDPHHDDGAGKRFLIGPLYALLGDFEGALKSFNWYQSAFPEDIAESFNHLCWVLALRRTKNENLAKAKLRELVFGNLYVVPIVLGESYSKFPYRHCSNWSEPNYVTEGPIELFDLWNEIDRVWLRSNWSDESLQADIRCYVELHVKLDSTNGREARGTIIDRASRIAMGREHLKLVQ